MPRVARSVVSEGRGHRCTVSAPALEMVLLQRGQGLAPLFRMACSLFMDPIKPCSCSSLSEATDWGYEPPTGSTWTEIKGPVSEERWDATRCGHMVPGSRHAPIPRNVLVAFEGSASHPACTRVDPTLTRRRGQVTWVTL